MSAAALLAGSTLAVMQSSAVRAEGTPPSDGIQTQAELDAAHGTEGNSSNQGGWADLAGGLTARPYVTSLSLTNGDTTTEVLSGGQPVATPVDPGGIGAVVAPVNLCPAGQPEQPGTCYATPNRVAITLVYGADGGNGWDFSSERAAAATPAVTEDTVVDMTVALNSLGKNLRWSQLNGHLLDWRTDNLGQDDATVHVRFRPAVLPAVDWSTLPANGCTATPINNCDIAQAQSERLGASLLFSLDDTLDPALTGAVFATQNALAGYLQPGGTAAAPLLDIQAASTHLTSSGELQRGTIEAFLPAGALLNLYGVLPTDTPYFFSTTRTGSAGTNDAPTYTPWTASADRSEGVLITVNNITFSVPTYRVKNRLKPVSTTAKASGRTTTVRAGAPGCTPKSPCRVSLYEVGRSKAARYSATRTAVVQNRTVTTKSLSLGVRSATLAKGDRYLLVVRNAKTKRPIASTLGRVG
ncbi:hypothetical protein [Actinoplanes sp. NPDC051859]|uniref:hypothetical protein n=1 Tax=Actinoplanes sp. NPDC051859 TaxID=3363909 RepID=UPI0037A0EA19